MVHIGQFGQRHAARVFCIRVRLRTRVGSSGLVLDRPSGLNPGGKLGALARTVRLNGHAGVMTQATADRIEGDTCFRGQRCAPVAAGPHWNWPLAGI